MSVNTDETLQLVKDALSKPDDVITGNLNKSISQATGLVAFDLQAPAKNLYPTNTPIRNALPRTPGGTGTATNWRQVTAIIGSGYDAIGFVPEGQRSARMSYTTATKAASYVTIGEEDQISFEARNAAQGFEDAQAKMIMRLLQKAMLKEESAILGANASLALGTTPTPVPSTATGTATGTITTGVVCSFICVALTFEGWRNFTNLVTGINGSQVITGSDGLTYTVNGGSAQKSAAANVTTGAGSANTASATVTPVVGAFAYAWYMGTVGNEKLGQITTINSVLFNTVPATGQLASALAAADNSRNASLAFDGLLTAASNPANGAVIVTQGTGVAGTGTPLTPGTRGNVVELDTLLSSMWNQYQVSPTVLYCNAQEIKNITNKSLQGTAGAPLIHYMAPLESGLGGDFGAGGGINYYYNPFAMGTGYKIPIKIHPFCPPGTIIGWCENLPAQYQSNDVPNVAEIKTRQDYYQINWPLRTRQQEVGVYMEEVLAIYAPFALGMITNIANG